MDFYLNGRNVTYKGDLSVKLLKYLREIEGITTPKDGCNCQGACGACTVEIDGKATLACMTAMDKIKGKHVITTDGFEQKIQDAFAIAFVEKGGIQCGYCIPGIVVTAKTLLIRNPNPTRDEVTKAINKHLCRCTGYKKIVDSIMYAAKILRGEDVQPPTKQSGKVGTSLMKYDAYDAVLGMRKFVADYYIEDMHWGALKFSDHPKAIVKKIDVSDAQKIKGVVKIVTAKDIPGERIVGLIRKDWPMMIAEGETTRYIGDVLAGVVAISEDIAREAVSKIKVTYKELKPVTTVDQAKRQESIVHPSMQDNILSHTHIKKGNIKEALKNSKYVAKGTYYTQRIEHAFIEPECALAIPKKIGISEDIHIDLLSQGQGAYEDRKGIAKILGITHDRLNVTQVQMGGGFGGKEDLSVQHHAALYAFLTNKPVRVELKREESIRMHPKRHPMRLKYTLGCDEKGMLTALIAKIDGDTGAYASVGMKVLERAAGHSTSAYQVLNLDVEATSYYTNNVPCGAMRGFGVNQAAFAMEGCIDDLCKQGGFDPWEFRYQNALDVGKQCATGQVITGGIGLKKCLEAVKDEYQKAPYAGIAVGIKNTGIGNGMADTTKAKIVIEDHDHIVIHHGWTEMGQGVHTMAIQTVCEETGLSPDIMEVKVETREDVECGMTTSSRGTSLVGHALIDACKKLNADLKNNTLFQLKGKVYRGEWICDWTTDPEDDAVKEQITHYSYAYACQVVTLKKNGDIDKVIAAHDAGRIMNPVLFEGQIEGSVHMGLGYALTEKLESRNGIPTTFNLGKLGMIRAVNTPNIEVIGVESNDPHGPFGAKGVGEVGLVPTAAAVAGALFQFDGKKRYSLPIGFNPKKR